MQMLCGRSRKATRHLSYTNTAASLRPWSATMTPIRSCLKPSSSGHSKSLIGVASRSLSDALPDAQGNVTSIEFMSNALEQLSYFRVKPTGIVQVGASWGQEVESFRRAGVPQAVFIEPLPDAYAQLSQRATDASKHYVAIQALCGTEDGAIATFHVASNAGMSSSMLPPADHTSLYPDIDFKRTITLETRRLDTIMQELRSFADLPSSAVFNTLFLDTQGTEMQVLLGAENTLRSDITAIWTEVSHVDLYRGGVRFNELIAFLAAFGFGLVALQMKRAFWGNALFLRMRDRGASSGNRQA